MDKAIDKIAEYLIDEIGCEWSEAKKRALDILQIQGLHDEHRELVLENVRLKAEIDEYEEQHRPRRIYAYLKELERLRQDLIEALELHKMNLERLGGKNGLSQNLYD